MAAENAVALVCHSRYRAEAVYDVLGEFNATTLREQGAMVADDKFPVSDPSWGRSLGLKPGMAPVDVFVFPARLLGTLVESLHANGLTVLYEPPVMLGGGRREVYNPAEALRKNGVEADFGDRVYTIGCLGRTPPGGRA
jgi:hypothetical protein